MCADRDLAQGGSKEACAERLLEALKKTDGELDKILAGKARAARHEELQAMGKEALLKMCLSLGISPFVKEIMVERILTHEEESGSPVGKPATKKARKMK